MHPESIGGGFGMGDALSAPLQRAAATNFAHSVTAGKKSALWPIQIRASVCSPGIRRASLGACRTWKSSAANRPQRTIFNRLFAP
jgi:hypothetical protein